MYMYLLAEIQHYYFSCNQLCQCDTWVPTSDDAMIRQLRIVAVRLLVVYMASPTVYGIV